MVRADNPASGDLTANPQPGQYDGQVTITITISVPVQATATADAYEIGMAFELVADSD